MFISFLNTKLSMPSLIKYDKLTDAKIEVIKILNDPKSIIRMRNFPCVVCSKYLRNLT